MSSTNQPMLTAQQREDINTALATLSPGTIYGPMREATARKQLAGEGFDDIQIEAMLTGRGMEIKRS